MEFVLFFFYLDLHPLFVVSVIDVWKRTCELSQPSTIFSGIYYSSHHSFVLAFSVLPCTWCHIQINCLSLPDQSALNPRICEQQTTCSRNEKLKRTRKRESERESERERDRGREKDQKCQQFRWKAHKNNKRIYDTSFVSIKKTARISCVCDFPWSALLCVHEKSVAKRIHVCVCTQQQRVNGEK